MIIGGSSVKSAATIMPSLRDNVRLCQAHIFTEATADWHSKLRFRDVLRQNPELAREDDDYKQRLAKGVANKSEYAEIKTRWVDTFIMKVMREHNLRHR